MQLEARGLTAFQRPNQEDVPMDPSISHRVFEAETEELMGSSFNTNMLEESIRASLKPRVICLCFFSAFLSQLGGTVGFYYILLFQQTFHE